MKHKDLPPRNEREEIKSTVAEADVQAQKKSRGRISKLRTTAASASGKPDKEWQNKIETELREIYRNDDGSLPDMGNFQKRKRRRLIRALLFLIVACGFLGAVAYVGFFIIQPKSQFSQEDVVLSISGEESVMIGGDVRYRARFRNAQHIRLTKATLQVRYPEGFVYRESSKEPINDKHDTWNIGTLAGDESGYIDLFGTMYGDLNTKQSFRMFLNYYPENFSSEFQKVATAEVAMKEAPTTLSVEAPETAAAGMDIPFMITLTRKEGVGSEPLRVVIDGGASFRKIKSSPASDALDPNRWTFANATTTAVLTLSGVFEESAGEKGRLTVRLYGLPTSSTRPDAQGYLYGEEVKDIVLTKRDIGLQAVINGTSGAFSVQPGDILGTTVVVKNTGETPLNHVQVRALFDAPSYHKQSMLDWANLEEEKNGRVVGEQQTATIRRGSITWTAKEISALASLKPGEETLIDFSIPLKKNEEGSLADYPNEKIRFVAEVQYDGANDTRELLSSSDIVMTVNSDLTFESRDEVMPQETGFDAHVISWILSNSLHGLKDIHVTADMYGNTTWDEKAVLTPAGEVIFDKDKQSISWTIPEMPESVDILALKFRLVRNEKNPSQSQLVSKVKIEATDTVTNEKILLVGDEVVLQEGIVPSN